MFISFSTDCKTEWRCSWKLKLSQNPKVAKVNRWQVIWWSNDKVSVPAHQTRNCIFSPLHPGCSRSHPAGWLYTAWFSLSSPLSKETWTGDWWMTCGRPGPPLAAPDKKTDRLIYGRYCICHTSYTGLFCIFFPQKCYNNDKPPVYCCHFDGCHSDVALLHRP